MISWLFIPQPIPADRLEADLRAIISRRFNSKLDVSRHVDRWNVLYKPQPFFTLTVGLRRTRCIVFREESGSGWPLWCEHVVRSELGVLYKGECANEKSGDHLRWTPDPSRWPTYERFVREVYRRDIERFGESFVNSRLTAIPPGLR